MPEANTSEQDNFILKDHDATVMGRARIELAIVRELLRRLTLAGYTIQVDTRGDLPSDAFEHSPENTMRSLLRIFNLDECTLMADNKRGRPSFITLIMGNDGYDVISDYGMRLEHVMEPLSEWINSYESTGVPPSVVTQTIIRIWIEKGLIAAVTGLPEGCTLRKIDLDVEGADEDATHRLVGDDIPPYCDLETREGAGLLRGRIGNFHADGSESSGGES